MPCLWFKDREGLMPTDSYMFIYSSSLSPWASCLGTKINEI